MSDSTTQIVIILAALGGVLAVVLIGVAIVWPLLTRKRLPQSTRQRKGASLATVETGLYGGASLRDSSFTGLVPHDSHPYNPWARMSGSQSRTTFRSSFSTPSYSLSDLTGSASHHPHHYQHQHGPRASWGGPSSSMKNQVTARHSRSISARSSQVVLDVVDSGRGGLSNGQKYSKDITFLPHHYSEPTLRDSFTSQHPHKHRPGLPTSMSPPPDSALPELPNVELTPVELRLDPSTLITPDGAEVPSSPPQHIPSFLPEQNFQPPTPTTANSVINDPTPQPAPFILPAASSSQASLRANLAPLKLLIPSRGPNETGGEREVSRWSAETPSAIPSSRVLPPSSSEDHGRNFRTDPTAPSVPPLPFDRDDRTPVSPYPGSALSPQTPFDPGNRASDARIQDWSPGGIFTANRVVSTDVMRTKIPNSLNRSVFEE